MPNVVLHQWEISPFCGKVRRILATKGVAFTIQNYNGLKAPGAAKLTPAGKLPVIDYDGERVADSSRIAEFLERKHPDPALFPADPRDRALALTLEDWADESLFWFEVYFRFGDPEAARRSIELLCEGRPGYERTLVGIAVKRTYAGRLKAQGIGRLTRDEVERRFREHLDRLDLLLDGKSFLVADAISIADIAVASQLREVMRTHPIGNEVESRAKLQAWLDRIPS